MDVADWLRTLGLEQYAASFRENDVNAALLPTLTAADLKDLGVTSVGHRRRLLNAVAALRPGGSASVPDPTETAAELRPLNVLFCDLIGFTTFRRGSIPRLCGRSFAPIRGV